MYNNLKYEIEKDFNKEKNYNHIVKKIEGGNSMKTFQLKYVLIPICLVLLLVAGIIGADLIKNNNLDKNIEKSDGTNAEQQVHLNINQIKEMSSVKSDADVETKKMESLPNEFKFMESIKMPIDLRLADSYQVYTKSNRDIAKYDLLHDYVFIYHKDETKNIIIAFSTLETPLRDYYIDQENKISKIGEVSFEISQYKEMYIVTFHHQNLYFDIETTGITETELIELLKSLIF